MKIRHLFFMAFVLLLILAGCSSEEKRDISTLESSIIGHWKTVPKDSETPAIDYYISDSKMIMIDQGVKSIFDYKVTKTNENENWIEIEIISSNNGYIKHLQFHDDNRNALTEKVSLNILPENLMNEKLKDTVDSIISVFGNSLEQETDWEYAGSETEPPK